MHLLIILIAQTHAGGLTRKLIFTSVPGILGRYGPILEFVLILSYVAFVVILISHSELKCFSHSHMAFLELTSMSF